MFIKYCIFSKILKYILDSGLSRFPLVVSVCTQWQVKHQRCSITCRVQKNHNILRKNTIFNEHPVGLRQYYISANFSNMDFIYIYVYLRSRSDNERVDCGIDIFVWLGNYNSIRVCVRVYHKTIVLMK